MADEWTRSSEECLRGLSGKKVVGFTTKEGTDGGIERANIFLDDGTLFVVKGDFWRSDKPTVQEMLTQARNQFTKASARLQELITLIGQLPA